MAQDHRMNLHEVSAKEGTGVLEMVNDVLSQVYIQKIRPQLQGDGQGAGAAQQRPAAIDRPSFPLNHKSQLKKSTVEG